MNFHGNPWMLPGMNVDYRISRWHDASALGADKLPPVLSRSLLNTWLSASSTRAVLDDIYKHLGGMRPLGTTTLGLADYEERLKVRLYEAFQRGELIVTEIQRSLMRGGYLSPTPPPERSARTTSEKTFIAIRLEDEGGNAVSAQRYRIVLPDGSTREGRLDDKGVVQVNKIPPGKCKIFLPSL